MELFVETGNAQVVSYLPYDISTFTHVTVTQSLKMLGSELVERKTDTTQIWVSCDFSYTAATLKSDQDYQTWYQRPNKISMHDLALLLSATYPGTSRGHIFIQQHTLNLTESVRIVSIQPRMPQNTHFCFHTFQTGLKCFALWSTAIPTGQISESPECRCKTLKGAKSDQNYSHSPYNLLTASGC